MPTPTCPADKALSAAFAAHSPRIAGVRTHWRGALIHLAVLLTWVGLCVSAMGGRGWAAWSVGVWFVVYDTALQLLTLLAPRWPARPQEARKQASPAAQLTMGVVVAARNEAAVLPTAVAELLAQLRPMDQLVIADDGSTDGTADWLQQRYRLQAPPLGKLSEPSPVEPRLVWLRLPGGGKARALNTAIARLGTDLVLTVDADTLLEPGALPAMWNAFAFDERLVAATGVLSPVCAGHFQGRVLQWFQRHEYVRNFLSRRAWARLDGLLLISGAFAAFRRGALLRVGGFDTECLVEDYEVIHRLRRYGAEHGLGWRTAVVANAKARTDSPADAAALLRQRRRWFGGFLQTHWWYRDMVGERRYGAVGTRMLPVKAVDTLQPLFGLVGVGVLLACLAQRRWDVLAPAAGFLAVKVLLDAAYQIWAVLAYRRWTGGREPLRVGSAALAALLQPWSFQILLQLGAAWGWWHFLTGRIHWGSSSRGGLPAASVAEEQSG